MSRLERIERLIEKVEERFERNSKEIDRLGRAINRADCNIDYQLCLLKENFELGDRLMKLYDARSILKR